MEGTMKALYKVLCDNDINVEVGIEQIAADEDVMKVIRRKFGKSTRAIEHSVSGGKIVLSTLKQLHEVEFPKMHYMDTLELCEEDARSKRLLKKECQRVEVVDIMTESGMVKSTSRSNPKGKKQS